MKRKRRTHRNITHLGEFSLRPFLVAGKERAWRKHAMLERTGIIPLCAGSYFKGSHVLGHINACNIEREGVEATTNQRFGWRRKITMPGLQRRAGIRHIKS